MNIIRSTAEFSPCRRWRYSLFREFDGGSNCIAFIGLNPSTADETTNDPTVSRCIRFAQQWGYGSMYMLNIFAWRDTDPRGMKAAKDPVGPGNHDEILTICGAVGTVVACWGVHGAFLQRGQSVANELLLNGVQLQCFGITKDGHPKHPLYLRADSTLISFRKD